MRHPLRQACAGTLLAVGLALPTLGLAQSCTLLGSSLPPADPIADPNGITYRKWNDRCIGPTMVTWQEWKFQNEWKAGVSQLALRFDYYQPAAAQGQLGPNGKLVIWAHPVGQTENITTTSPLWREMAVPLIRAGYSLMSVETRHAADSFVSADSVKMANDKDFPHPPVTEGSVPRDDIANAVRWAKHKATALGLDGNNIVLVGQSRGSMVLLNGLLDPAGTGTGWLGRNSRVKGIYTHQAQTSFRELQVMATFIKPDEGDKLYRTWFDEDFPFLPNGDALSAIDQAAVSEIIPVHMGYEQTRVLLPDGSIELQCYESNNLNRLLQEPPAPTDRCPTFNKVKKSFDVHDPNYSEAFAQVYSPRAPGKFSRCFALEKDRLDRAYGSDLVGFVDAATSGQPFAFTPACGGVAQDP